MYLKKLQVQNYRSIENIDLDFAKWKNIIVWKNNAGKSNIIKALDIVLWENSPTYAKSENIQLSDFYTKYDTDGNEVQSDEILILAILKKEDQEIIDFKTINTCFWVKKYNTEIPSNDNLKELSDIIFSVNPDILARWETTRLDWKVEWLMKISKYQEELTDKYEFWYLFKAKVEWTKIIKEIRFLCRQDNTSNRKIWFNAPIRSELIMSAIIPSFRDPMSQLRLNNRTWYGKMMKQLTENHPDIVKIEKALEEVKKVSNIIFSDVQTQIKSTALDIAFPWIELSFQFSDDKKNELYKSTKIYLNDWVKTTLENKWSWVQSATIIGLFNYYTKEINTITSALLCIEEPELYLHPHARRVISDKLDLFSDGWRHQVILTTHSPEFIRSVDPTLNITLVSKWANWTQGKKVQIQRLKQLLTDEKYSEIFFADKVVLCENYDSYIIKTIADFLFPWEINANNISIIWVGGKDNFNQFFQLIRTIWLKCYIMSDFDFILRDKEHEIMRYKDENGNSLKKRSNLSEIENTFFKQENTFWTDGDNIKKEIREIREKIKKEEEELFYKWKKTNQFANQDSLEKITSKLRTKGIWILNWEIEDLFLDKDLLSIGTKLSLSKIFELNEHINNWSTINSILDTNQVKDFLSHVIMS